MLRGKHAGFFIGLWLDKDDGEEDLLPAGGAGVCAYPAGGCVAACRLMREELSCETNVVKPNCCPDEDSKLGYQGSERMAE